MKRIQWTEQDVQTLHTLAKQGLSAREIATAMNRNVGNINARIRLHNITLTKRQIKTVWTDEMLDYLRANYATVAGTDIAKHLGVPLSSVYNYAYKIDLKKDPSFAAETTRQRWAQGRHENSRKAHFSKGQEPKNKGRPMSEWMSAESMERLKPTQFKKGRAPEEARNYKPIGSLRVTRDGILEQKVSDDPSIYPARRWVSVARLVWEREMGEIPPDHSIVFKKGMNTTNFDEITIDKLLCLDRADLARHNSYHNNYPKEVGRLIQLRGALTRQINKKERNTHEK